MPSQVHDPLWKRCLLASPLVPLFVWPWIDSEASAALVVPYLLKMVEDGGWTSTNSQATISMSDRHLHVPALDQAMNPLLAVFTPSLTGIDPVGRLQMISFLADVSPLFVIGMLEKFRRHHHPSAVIYPVLFAIASQILGIGKLAGGHFLLEYFWAPTTKLRTAESALIPARAALSLLAAMLLVYYPLLLASYTAPTTEARITFNAAWQLFPILVVVVQAGLSRFFFTEQRSAASPPTEKQQQPSKAPTTTTTRSADPPTTSTSTWSSIRLTIITLCTLSALTFVFVRFTRPPGVSMAQIFLPLDTGTPIDSFETAVRRLLQWDHIGWVIPGYYWLLLSFRDLGLRGGVNVSWGWVLVVLVLGT
ncbi:hypothetical protein BJX64DRAFT_294337, partial [Aspergillus heterothallicus]